MAKISILVLTGLIHFTHSSIVASDKDAQDYLEYFGYLRFPDSEDNVSAYSGKSSESPETAGSSKMKNETFKEVLSVFQEYVGIAPTGLLDNETVIMMNKPRCGMAERVGLTENKNMNRRILSHKIPRRRKWRTSNIYYRIDKFPSNGSTMDSAIVRNEIRRAFRLWESAANIRCIELGESDKQLAEIDISFVIGDHGDGSSFGDASIGNVVAHAFFPDHHHFEGDIHFDSTRQWTAYFHQGINLYQVAAHEIGHALGLDHSKFPDAVMHMMVHSELKERFELHEDDIKGIQNLYGRKRRSSRLHPRQRGQHQRDHPNRNSNHVNVNANQAGRYTMEQPHSTEKSKTEVLQAKVLMSDNPGGENPLENTLNSFWECFEMSYEPRSSKNATECYKQNVLKLLYSMQL